MSEETKTDEQLREDVLAEVSKAIPIIKQLIDRGYDVSCGFLMPWSQDKEGGFYVKCKKELK